MEVGAQTVQGLPLLTEPAPRQSYASMAGKPVSSSHERSPLAMEPGTCHTELSVEKLRGRAGGKRMIQRRNQEGGR